MWIRDGKNSDPGRKNSDLGSGFTSRIRNTAEIFAIFKNESSVIFTTFDTLFERQEYSVTTPIKLYHGIPKNQCWRSVTFWCGSGPGSPDRNFY